MSPRTLTVVPPSRFGSGVAEALCVLVARFMPKAAAINSLESDSPMKLAAETAETVFSALALKTRRTR